MFRIKGMTVPRCIHAQVLPNDKGGRPYTVGSWIVNGSKLQLSVLSLLSVVSSIELQRESDHMLLLREH